MVLSERTGAPLRLVRPTEDWNLVVRCAAGDPVAQRELFEREKLRVHRLLFRVVGSNLHMDDLMQDTFLEVFRSLASFRGESSLGTWIDRCAVRVAYAHFKRKGRLPVLQAIEDEPTPEAGAEERATMREAVQRVYHHLNELEPRQRIAFTLFAIEGRTQQEVAMITGANVGTVKIRVWRARRTLEQRAKKDSILSEFLMDAALRDEDKIK
jgi:RNA polymerase sigma-70 factor, ECF subfamily